MEQVANQSTNRILLKTPVECCVSQRVGRTSFRVGKATKVHCSTPYFDLVLFAPADCTVKSNIHPSYCNYIRTQKLVGYYVLYSTVARIHKPRKFLFTCIDSLRFNHGHVPCHCQIIYRTYIHCSTTTVTHVLFYFIKEISEINVFCDFVRDV
jgi:hypothetical protein